MRIFLVFYSYLLRLADLYLPFSSNNSDIPAVMEANILRVGSTQATPLSTARLVNSLSKLEFSLKNLKPGTRELLVDLTMKAIKADLPWVSIISILVFI